MHAVGCQGRGMLALHGGACMGVHAWGAAASMRVVKACADARRAAQPHNSSVHAASCCKLLHAAGLLHAACSAALQVGVMHARGRGAPAVCAPVAATPRPAAMAAAPSTVRCPKYWVEGAGGAGWERCRSRLGHDNTLRRRCWARGGAPAAPIALRPSKHVRHLDYHRKLGGARHLEGGELTQTARR